MLRNVLSNPLNLTAAVNRLISRRHSDSPSPYSTRRLFSGSPASQTRVSELPRVDSLVEGCDYRHWFVVMQPPENYPRREEIIQQYVDTLSMALGSEKAAKESIYSVSTKYYYAFSCRVDESVTSKIKCLPRVKWVLPDSYFRDEEGGYGGIAVSCLFRMLLSADSMEHLGEPFVDGKAVPYEDKYHAGWVRDTYNGGEMERTRLRNPRRRRSSRNATNN